MPNVTRTGQGAENPVPAAWKNRNPLVSLRDEMDRLFDTFMGGPLTRNLFELDPFRRMGSALRLGGEIAPDMEVRETEDKITVTAELPGLDESDVTVSVKDGVLTISGEKKEEHTEKKADYLLSERSYGSFMRGFRLPETADLDSIDADFSKGVLTVSVPKKAEAVQQEKKIEVKKH